MRRLLFAAVVAVVALPAVSAEAPEAGRYQITAATDGFIRLDSRTGATSHCTQQDGVWRCEPVIESDGALAAELGALSVQVDRLAAALAEMGARVDDLAARLEAPPPVIAADEDRGLLATAMARLLDVVRALKHGRTGEV